MTGETARAQSIAKSFLLQTGKKLVLNETQWRWFKDLGMDMSLFQKQARIPAMPVGYDG